MTGFPLATLLTACTPKPGMVQATSDGFQACPITPVAAWRRELARRSARDRRDAMKVHFDRAVAEWAVCAHVRQVGGWTVPPLDDPAAQAVVFAAIVTPGSRRRMEAIEAAAPVLPQAAAILALEELDVLRVIARAPPPDQLDLVVAAMGAWGCPATRVWVPSSDGQDVGLCPAATDAVQAASDALVRLVALARPSLDGESSVGRLLAREVASSWDRLEEVALVRPVRIDVALPESAAGIAIAPTAATEPVWSVRPDESAFRFAAMLSVTREGVLEADLTFGDPRAAGWRAQPVWAEPWVYADRSVRVGTIAEATRQPDVHELRLVGTGPSGPVELPVRLRPGRLRERPGPPDPRRHVRPDGFDPDGLRAAAAEARGGVLQLLVEADTPLGILIQVGDLLGNSPETRILADVIPPSEDAPKPKD